MLNHTIHQTNSKRLEKNNEKSYEKTAEVFRKVMESNQELLGANKLERANIVLKQLFKVESLTLDVDGYVLIQGKPTLVKIESFSFLYDTQQNSKKFEGVFYPQILKELNLDPSLVSNTYAKQIFRSLKSEAAKPSTSSSFVSDNPTTEDSKRSKPSSSKTRPTTLKPRTKQSDKRKTQKKEFSPPTTTMTRMIKTMKPVKNRLRRRQQKNGNPTISEKLKILYTKGPAAFGSVKNLTNANQLSPKKLKFF